MKFGLFILFLLLIKQGSAQNDTTLYRHLDSVTLRRAQIPPMFPGGPQVWPMYLNGHLKYPRDARKQKIEGTVVLDFTVGLDGRPKDVQVVKPVFLSIDKEAVRLIENTLWVPAVHEGHNVIYRDRRSIEFHLPS